MDPLISVGVPVFNEERTIWACLESIARDAYRSKEILISDNGSVDATWRIAQEFKRKYDDMYVIRINRQPSNIGSVENFNYVLAESSGEYFAWVGAHDLWGTNFASECITTFRQHCNAVLVVPMVKWIDDDANVLDASHCVIDTRSGHSPAGRVLQLFGQWTECTAIYGLHRREALRTAMPWPRTLSADNIALVRIAKQGDIVPVESTCYLRRARPLESRGARMSRQLAAMNVMGIARSRPRTIYKLLLLSEVASAGGPLRIRLKLIIELLRQLPAIIVAEFMPGMYRALKKIEAWLLG